MTTIDSSAEAYTSIDDLSVELADGVLSVTLNRPDSLNSLTAAMLKGIADALEQRRWRSAGQGGAARRRRARLLVGRGDQRRGPRQPRRERHACRRARRGQPRGELDRELAAAGRGGRAGTGRRSRCVTGTGLRCRIGFGEGVFHAGIHEDRADARRWGVGVDRRGGRPYPRDADGADGRTDFGGGRLRVGPGDGGLSGRSVRRRGLLGDLHAGVAVRPWLCARRRTRSTPRR